MRSVRAIVEVLLVAALCAAIPGAAQAEAAWYPGRLLSVEPLGRQWGGLAGVQRIGYVTTGPGGGLTAAEAIVRMPEGTAPAGGWRTVAWGHGTSGLSQQCGFTGSERLEQDTGPSLRRLNDAGYAVVAPDYIGLSPRSPGPHPYLQTGTEATATVDSVRAARSAFPGLSESWAAAGFSQGGHAALGTGRFAPEYAPELDFRGTAALSPVSNLETIFLRARPDQPEMPGFPGTAVTMVLAGMAGTQQDVDISDYLTPGGRRFVAGLETGCSDRASEMLAGARIGEMLSRPLDDPAFELAIRDYMEVPVSGYQDPVLIVHGIYDAVVPLPLTLTLSAQLLQHRTRHELQLLEAGHELLDKGGMDRAVAFLGKVLPAR